MKVLQINSVCGIRSTGRICSDIADILAENGDQCKIAYGREVVPERAQGYAHKIGSDFSCKVDALKTRLFDNAGFNSKRATRELVKWIEEYNPDIIHLHNLHGYYINIDILFGYLREIKKPVVWTLHDCWAFTGHCPYYSMADCEKWRKGCFDCPQFKDYPASVFLDNSSKNYKRKKQLFTSMENMMLVTPSEWLAGIVRESFMGKYPVVAIPNGIDLDLFKPTESSFRKEYGLENKKIVLGVASTWGESKGINVFAELSRILPEEYKVVVVGMSQEDAQKQGLPKDILYISRTNSVQELSGIYTAADVFVNPSRQETMGLTTVEAMACGTPVVVSNYTAVPEVVDENGGIVVEDISPEKIFDAIKTVLNREYKNTVENAKKYEKKQQFLKYTELYRKCIGGEI